ncbi:MAG: hypothetical protein V2B18_17780 [Pseudomonadota bacterium]
MNKDEIAFRVKVLLSLQQALLDVVPPSLRGVTVGWDWIDRSVMILALFHGPVTDKDAAPLFDKVIKDMRESLGDDVDIKMPMMRHDFPARLQDWGLSEWVYWRREGRLDQDSE